MPKVRRRPSESSDTTYYSWSNIRVTDKTAKNGKTVYTPGTIVTPSMFEDAAEFDNLVMIGSIRSTPYPVGIRTDESPQRFRVRELKRLQDELANGYNPESEFEETDDEDGTDVEIVEAESDEEDE